MLGRKSAVASLTGVTPTLLVRSSGTEASNVGSAPAERSTVDKGQSRGLVGGDRPPAPLHSSRG